MYTYERINTLALVVGAEWFVAPKISLGLEVIYQQFRYGHPLTT